MRYPAISAATLLLMAISACGNGGDENTGTSREPGTELPGMLTFYANGEDFIREGFVTKDGWKLTFRHLYVTLDNVKAYQTDPPFDPHEDTRIISIETVELQGPITVDLAFSDGPVSLGDLTSVPAGHYNAISWDLIPAVSGPSEGYSIFIDGQAEKGRDSFNVYIGIEQGFRYMGGEFIGEQRKGFIEAGGSADLEITFHFDHIFGDASLPADDPLNVAAAGFEPFASMMGEGTIEADLSMMKVLLGEEFHNDLLHLLATLGHTGEGHCTCVIL
jgi:hypothetical protein